jgi:hypothetical protein
MMTYVRGARPLTRRARLGVALGLCLGGALVALAPRGAHAQTPVPGLHYPEWLEKNGRSSEPTPSEFKLINYFFTRGSVTNQLADPTGLRGVSLGPIGVGENIGSATRVGDKSTAYYVEQRWIPVLSYSPNFVDGLATFRAQFEVDFLWGQAANQVQQNQGGGFNADQINIQTKNVNVAIYPTRNPFKLGVVLGTQSIYDTIYDPAITSLTEIVRTGYKLTYFGTDATGVSVYGKYGGLWKASLIPMGAAQPDKALENDARLKFVWLGTLDYAYPVQPGTVVGLSLWHLQDATKGAAFAFEGLVKSGPSSSALSPYMGTSRFNIEAPNGGVTWLGSHFHHNINFAHGDFGASGFVMLNFGGYESSNPNTQLQKTVDIMGVSGNLELMYNYGQTEGDTITLEGMMVSGDSNPLDDKYTSAFTLNYYGIPGAVWFNHKTLILFPFTQTVSNYTGAVTDISNQGFGLMAAILSASKDLIPNTLNLKVGLATARTAVQPTPRELVVEGSSVRVERGSLMGTELNAELKWNIRYLMTVGLHAGVMIPGKFYDGNLQVDALPWAAFTTFTWYAF